MTYDEFRVLMTDLLKAKDVARLLDVDGSTVRGWIKSGRLPSIRTPGGQYRIERRRIEELLAQLNPQEKAAETVAA